MQKSIEKIEKILAGKNLEVMFARIASNLLRRNNLEEAIQICEHGLKKFSTYAQGHYVLAKCYQRKGMTEEARAEFERTLKFDFTHINSMRELAKIYKAAGLDDYYKEYLLKLFVIDPLNGDTAMEVRAAGAYDAWLAQENPPLQAATESPAPVEDQKDSGRKPQQPLENIYNRDKMDLSQFNNMQDDFTTILQGKQVPAGNAESAAAKTPPAPKAQEDWTEDISISYSDDTVQDEKPAADNGGEEIETAVQDLSFDEETDQIIEKEQTRESSADSAQVSLDFTEEANAKKMGPDISFGTAQGSPLVSAEDEEDLPFKPPKIISQTLGEILVSQKKYNEAMEVFKILKQKNPDNKNFDKKIEFLQKIIALEKEERREN